MNELEEMIKKTKKELLEELDYKVLINTYEKIIKELKADLHRFIDNPNDEAWTIVQQSIGCSPFLLESFDLNSYDYYEIHEDHLREIRDKLNVLVDFFMEYYIEFVKKGLEFDKLVLDSIEENT